MGWPSTVATGCFVLIVSVFSAREVAAKKTDRNSSVTTLEWRISKGSIPRTTAAAPHQNRAREGNPPALFSAYAESCSQIATFAELTRDTETHRLLGNWPRAMPSTWKILPPLRSADTSSTAGPLVSVGPGQFLRNAAAKFRERLNGPAQAVLLW